MAQEPNISIGISEDNNVQIVLRSDELDFAAEIVLPPIELANHVAEILRQEGIAAQRRTQKTKPPSELPSRLVVGIHDAAVAVPTGPGRATLVFQIGESLIAFDMAEGALSKLIDGFEQLKQQRLDGSPPKSAH